jgi:LEA14-like dessication related protein
MSVKRRFYQFIALATLLFLCGCASLSPGYEQPTVTLSSFKALPADGMVPAFEVGLRVINPNDTPLNLVGVVYTISLQGHELVKGVGNDLPVIDAYGEGELTLTASANLISGIRFIGGMMNSRSETLDYEFSAKLDLAGLYPSIYVRESGVLNLAEPGATSD